MCKDLMKINFKDTIQVDKKNSDINRQFTGEAMKIAIKPIKRCSTIFYLKKHHLKYQEMATIYKFNIWF